MSTLSATGRQALVPRPLEASLAEFRQWRQSTVEALAAFRRWALVHQLLDEQEATRLAHLERRLLAERLTIAFVAEYSRGKSELINALFFAEMGHRLLPAGAGRTTLCPTEIAWNPGLPPSIRLLPVDTRESERSLREYALDPSAWTEVALDPSRPESVAQACEVIGESLQVDPERAVALGFPAQPGAAVEIPRWRYALLNYPHPLLEAGLTLLDTPGHNGLGGEPELSVHRIPDAAAIVFMLTADTGVTRSDLALWSEHLAPVDGIQRRCYVVLNKIDGLRDGLKSEGEVLSEIDRQVRATAEALAMEPTRIFALSARQALVAKVQKDRDALLRSRLYRLEQALARGTVHERRLDHCAALRAELRPVFSEAAALLSGRLAFTRERAAELEALQARNQQLVETLARKSADERRRLEQAKATLLGLRSVHSRRADELGRLFDPNAVREAAIEARREVSSSAFSSGIAGAIDRFFRRVHGRLAAGVEVVHEARSMMASSRETFEREFGLAAGETEDFATERFRVELERLEERCERELKHPGSFALRGRKTLASLFFDTVALKVIHVFEIADREARTWMNGFIRPLDGQINARQEQGNSRIEGMGRIRDAETDLVESVRELRAIASELVALRGELQAGQERLAALLEVEREPSLA